MESMVAWWHGGMVARCVELIFVKNAMVLISMLQTILPNHQPEQDLSLKTDSEGDAKTGAVPCDTDWQLYIRCP